MAVQAQYPSNVLLLNRNIQEADHDYSLQPQPGGGGGVLQQPHLLFNNGGGNNLNMRKRGRDLTAPPSIINNPLCFQQSHHHPHLIDLSQLHNRHPSNVVSTGLRLSSGDQQNKLHQQPPPQDNLVSLSSSAFFSDDFVSHIKQQRDEIDQFLQAQEEQLRRALAEKRQRHFRELLGSVEESAARRLREKEAEMEKATRRNAELEARAARLSMEAQAWQAKARAQEATAATLQAQLQQAIMCGAGMGAQDKRIAGGREGVDCTVGAEGQAEDAESAYVDPDRVEAGSGPSCKACRKRVASVVLLPCRHLCVCTECDQVVQACPLCLAVRNSSVEVFLS